MWCEGPQRRNKRGTELLLQALPLRLLSMLSICSYYLRLFSMHALHMLAEIRIILELRIELSRVELDIIDLRIM